MLRPPLQPEKYGLKLKVVLKWKDIYIENIRIVLPIAGLKMEGTVKWRGLKSQGPLRKHQWHINYTMSWYIPV